ncbi:MAG TPA: nitronate monooxygenase [Thermomicrobiales bacterium]|nr:nitronate monooxygenase [Thermomicrobiales bacterium]
MVTPTNAPLRTALCDLLGIDYPILKAPMAGGTDTIDLVAAVSEAGGLGILGALMLSPDALRAVIRAIRTDRSPVRRQPDRPPAGAGSR